MHNLIGYASGCILPGSVRLHIAEFASIPCISRCKWSLADERTPSGRVAVAGAGWRMAFLGRLCAAAAEIGHRRTRHRAHVAWAIQRLGRLYGVSPRQQNVLRARQAKIDEDRASRP